MNWWNERFGDEGKLWHLGAIVAVSLTLWAIGIGLIYLVL